MKVILLVDDTAELLEAMTIYLERGGFNVKTAINGAEALRLIKSEEIIDAVVTDLQMPIMSGIELVNQSRSIGFDKPIIMWSGDMDPKLKGLNCFLHKGQTKEVVQMLKILLLEAA